jgi:N-acetylglucosamine-6-phosphate deacetylase
MGNSQMMRRSLLIRNVRLVLPHQVIEGAGLLIEDGCIARIFKKGGDLNVSAEETFDLAALTLLPGFIDVHLHGAIGVDTMEAETEDLHRVAHFLAQNGVTAWLPTLVPAPAEDYKRAARTIKALMTEQDARPAAARVLGLHYEGPFINSAQCGALRSAYFRTFKDAADLDALSLPDNTPVKRMITVAPEIDGGIELIKELVRRDWIVSLGHTRGDVQKLEDAQAAGARHLTHFMNAMSPLHHRAPGPIGWGLINDAITCDVIADGVHLDPLMLRLVLRSKTAARVTLISDAVAPTGLGDGEYNIWGETINVIQGRTQNSRGSIAGSVITMRDAVRMMLSLDVPVEDVARMASSNPAQLLGLHQESGSIEIGKRADLVALDQAGNVRLTLIGGRVAFESQL